LLAKGCPDGQLALKLGVSLMAATNCRQKVMRKLGLYCENSASS